MGEDADAFVAAGGHWGKQSPDLVRHYAQDLGYKYLFASNKEEFETACRSFIDAPHEDGPILFEVFTKTADEKMSLKLLRTSNQDLNKITNLKTKVKNAFVSAIGNRK